MTPTEVLIIALAGLAAGFVNAVAGGGTLISFPALTSIGIPTVSANVTNTVSLSPGYFGGALAQRAAVARQRHLLRTLAPASILGGLAGGVLLLVTSDALFRNLVPFMILAACALLATQDIIRARIERHRDRRAAALPSPTRPNTTAIASVTTDRPPTASGGAAAAVFVASIYGGYFGAGLSIILLAVLGVLVSDDLHDVNALKQCLAFAVNVTASIFFVFSGKVVWSAALIIAVASLIGGQIGGHVAGRLPARALRMAVVITGTAVAIVYLTR